MSTEVSNFHADSCTNHEDLCFTEEGELLLATSSLTNRYWKGKISLYKNLSSNHDQNLSPNLRRQLHQPPTQTSFSDNSITNVKYLPASKRAVSTHDSGEMVIWQIRKDEIIEVVCEVGHDDAILSLDVSSDQSRLATASSDCQLKIWSSEFCAVEGAYTGHSEFVSCTSFQPQSTHLIATCAYDKSLLFWDLRKLKPVCQSHRFTVLIPTTFAYLPSDNHSIVIGSESGQIVTMDTRNLTSAVSKSHPHNLSINQIVFSPQIPDLMATCSDDLQVIVSKVKADSSLKSLYNDVSHCDFVRGVAWSPSNVLASCSWDGLVYFHDVTDSLDNDSSKSGAGDA